jgi:hypothetical protein
VALYLLTNSGYVLRDDGLLIPKDPENTDYKLVLDWIAEGNTLEQEAPPPPPPAPPYTITKVQMYDRMTDEELTNLDAWLNFGATVRQRRLWNDAVEIQGEDPQVRTVANILFGVERTAIILAPVSA